MAQAALLLFAFGFLVVLATRRPWWSVALVSALLLWLTDSLVIYLVGPGFPVPRAKVLAAMGVGMLLPVVALWSQQTPPRTPAGRHWRTVLLWQSAGIVASALVPLALTVALLGGRSRLAFYGGTLVWLLPTLAAYALPVTLPWLGVWAILARRHPLMETSLWVRIAGLAGSAVLMACAATLIAPSFGLEEDVLRRVEAFLPATALVFVVPRLVVPSLRRAAFLSADADPAAPR